MRTMLTIHELKMIKIRRLWKGMVLNNEHS